MKTSIVAVGLACALASAAAVAGVPGFIAYQGRLTQGTNLYSGVANLRLLLYTNETGGVQIYEDTGTVSVVDGLYTTYLGDNTTYGNWPGVLTNAPLYVEVIVNSTILAPRERLASVAYALQVDEHDPLWSAVSNDIQGQITTETTTRAGADEALTNAVNAKLSTSTWAGADSTTNYVRRTGDTVSGTLSANAFNGNGAGLTGITGTSITDGTISNVDLAASVFNGTFWQITGNAGAVAGSNFLGTTDNVPLELRVNNARVGILRSTSGAPVLVFGHASNSIANPGSGSVISGGGSAAEPNDIGGAYSVVGGGADNSNLDGWSVIAGGRGNSVSTFDFVTQHDYGVIGGGVSNSIGGAVAAGNAAVIDGGAHNTVWEDYGVIGGGVSNVVSGEAAVIGGGVVNTSSAFASTVGGGAHNSAVAIGTTIAGGLTNRAAAGYATVGGGRWNTASGADATVAGGTSNIASGTSATIAGGNMNRAQGFESFIGGGFMNYVRAASDSMIGGGRDNVIDAASYNTIGGGLDNMITNNAASAVIAGGANNTVADDNGAIGGGNGNVNLAYSATIGGGFGNTISSNGNYGAIGGGDGNVVTGAYAVVPGGFENVASGTNSFAAGTRGRALHNGAFVWSDSRTNGFASVTNNELAISASNGVRVADNLGTNRLDRIGRFYRDNSVYAWAAVDATGGIREGFGVASVTNTAQGRYGIFLHASAYTGTAICAVATPELDSPPSSLAQIRLAGVNPNALSNSYFEVYINNGSGALTNNDFNVMVTGR